MRGRGRAGYGKGGKLTTLREVTIATHGLIIRNVDFQFLSYRAA
jgi:NADH:ubiquinone oxidoreductase subunit F (NADH-binding)